MSQIYSLKNIWVRNIFSKSQWILKTDGLNESIFSYLKSREPDFIISFWFLYLAFLIFWKASVYCPFLINISLIQFLNNFHRINVNTRVNAIHVKPIESDLWIWPLFLNFSTFRRLESRSYRQFKKNYILLQFLIDFDKWWLKWK